VIVLGLIPSPGGLRSSSTSSEAKGREVADVRKSNGDPDEDPNRQSDLHNRKSVTRALRLTAVFVLQVVVVAGVRKVLDWLVP